MTAPAAVLPTYDSREDLRRWTLAAAVVLAAHAGLMASYSLMPEEDSPGAFSAPAIILDFAPTPEAPPSPSDFAPGQLSEESEAKQAVVEKQQEVVEPQPKLEQPSDVTMPAEEPKPQEKREERPTPRTTATAPQRSDAPVAQTPRAPSPGSSDARSIQKWRDSVSARLQSVKRYPSGAGGAQGEVMIRFTVGRDGRVLGRRLVRSSGSSALDAEALAMVNRAAPFPPIPPEISGPSVDLPVPVRFTAR
jgi:periplasmic protein TonB